MTPEEIKHLEADNKRLNMVLVVAETRLGKALELLRSANEIVRAALGR